MVSIWKKHNQYPTKDLLLYYSENKTMPLNIFLETNSFFLNINVLNMISFVNDNALY